MTPTLLELPYSPWSELAKWALDARGITYARQRYQPLLGEPGLRRRLGRWRGPVSVPVLFTDDGPLDGTLAIARWADGRGDGLPLFPAAHDAEIVRWAERAQEGLAAGRALSLPRVADDPAAVAELTPKFARALGPVGRALTRSGVHRTRRKYGATAQTLDEHQAVLERVLEEIRAAIGATPRDGGLVGPLTYADFAAAQVLCYVDPPPHAILPIGAANRARWGDPDLAARYADVIAWRDELYARARHSARRE